MFRGGEQMRHTPNIELPAIPSSICIYIHCSL